MTLTPDRSGFGRFMINSSADHLQFGCGWMLGGIGAPAGKRIVFIIVGRQRKYGDLIVLNLALPGRGGIDLFGLIPVDGQGTLCNGVVA